MATLAIGDIHGNLAELTAAKRAGGRLYTEQCALPYEVFFGRLPATHLRFFESLAVYHKTPDCICTHGGLNPRVDRIEDQARFDLIWGSDDFPDGYKGDEILVYGHRNNAVVDDEGRPMPRVIGRTIGIDTIAHGVLTAIILPDQRVFQSARRDTP